MRFEWYESDYNIPETLGRLYNCYYEDFNRMILSWDNEYYINQMNKETKSGHDLYGMKLIPEAKSEMNGDVIFLLIQTIKKLLSYSFYIFRL